VAGRESKIAFTKAGQSVDGVDHGANVEGRAGIANTRASLSSATRMVSASTESRPGSS
jgi:hypothetical protein